MDSYGPTDVASSSLPERAPSSARAAAATRGSRVALFIATILAVALAGLIGVRVKQALAKKAALVDQRVAAQASAQAKPLLGTISPAPIRYRPTIDVTGTLRPWRDADVGFELGGRLQKVLVSIGDEVHEGQTLAILDGSSAAAQVLQAEASARAAEAQAALADDNAKRSDALVQSKSIPEQQAEQSRHQADLARAQLEAARAAAKMAQTGAGNHAIVAPFAGLITKAPTAAGGVVQPGAPLLHLEDLSRFRLSITVGEDDASLVKVGAPVKIEMRERTVTGKVVTVVPSLDQATRRAPVEVEVDNDAANPLLGWSFVRATIDSGQDVDALKIPGNARLPGSQDEVVVNAGGHAHIVHVVHSIDPDGSWIVRSGLAPTDVVVLEPDSETKDGDALTLANASAGK